MDETDINDFDDDELASAEYAVPLDRIEIADDGRNRRIAWYVPGESRRLHMMNWYWNISGTNDRCLLALWDDGRMRLDRHWYNSRHHDGASGWIHFKWKYDSGHWVDFRPQFNNQISSYESMYPKHTLTHPDLQKIPEVRTHFETLDRDDVTCWAFYGVRPH